MAAITPRMTLNGAIGSQNWERVIFGRRYWFTATPWAVKAWRLSRDGGELVHSWEPAPETVGRYDCFDSATRPELGEVAWSPHWSPRSTERQYWTACRVCREVVEVTFDQLVADHKPRYDAGACPGAGTAATLKAAVVRDAQLNPAEKRVASRGYAWLISCKGYQMVSDGSREDCYHPHCRERLEAGYSWTLSGWKRNTD
ncbi:hypothetical protein [Streptomyces sp. t39]|uniref:hypothetical protein n=1 Tax=Streptomyces sp. t39 TaxID=1828156 RepID=UPI0011CDBBA9|nr:hypothetical protein [Streptomyces sp. t39]